LSDLGGTHGRRSIHRCRRSSGAVSLQTDCDGQIRTLQRHIAVWRAHTILAFNEDWNDEGVDAGQILPQPLRAAVDVDNTTERSA
jgi:hypothetical protein